jgi:hypothetical protein
MALLSFCGFDTPSVQAQGEQRLLHNFNIRRDNPTSDVRAWQLRHGSSLSDMIQGSPLMLRCGQMNPAGQRKRRMYSRQASSSRNDWSISWNVRG